MSSMLKFLQALGIFIYAIFQFDEIFVLLYIFSLRYGQAYEPSGEGLEVSQELAMPLYHPNRHSILCKMLSKVLHREKYIDEVFRDLRDGESHDPKNCGGWVVNKVWVLGFGWGVR